MLPDCLRSLVDRVDDIVVVDAHSDDGTADIARDFGARVIGRAWNGDFAAARNAALDAHRCDYSLYIDADERLGLPGGGYVSDFIDPAARFHLVRFQPRVGFTRYGEWRIFRNEPDIRFEGHIHETVVPSARRLGEEPRFSTVEIDHIGYEGPMAHKWQRNLPMLEQAVKADPDRAYLWFDLAECRNGLKRIEEAREAVEQGLAAARRRGGRDQEAARSLLLNLKALLTDGLAERMDVLRHGLSLRDDDHGMRFLLGQCCLDAGFPEEALMIAKGLALVDPDALFEGPLAFDRRIFRDAAAELEGLALLAMGREGEAGQAFGRAADLAPDNRTYRLRQAALLRLCGVGGEHAS